MDKGVKIQGPCPSCGRPSWGYEDFGRIYRCAPCVTASLQRDADFQRALRDRFPTLPGRVVGSFRRFSDGGLDAALAATDDELLDIRNFGKGALADWRRHVPEPVPLSFDSWREHAEMLAGVR